MIAKIPGRVKPDETVQFAAHWDAYGEGPPDAQGRTIRPGAIAIYEADSDTLSLRTCTLETSNASLL